MVTGWWFQPSHLQNMSPKKITQNPKKREKNETYSPTGGSMVIYRHCRIRKKKHLKQIQVPKVGIEIPSTPGMATKTATKIFFDGYHLDGSPAEMDKD